MRRVHHRILFVVLSPLFLISADGVTNAVEREFPKSACEGSCLVSAQMCAKRVDAVSWSEGLIPPGCEDNRRVCLSRCLSLIEMR